MSNKDSAEYSAKAFLLGIRKSLKKSDISNSNLLKWVSAADIQIGKLEEGTIILFDDVIKGEEDKITYREVENDTKFFFPEYKSDPKTALLNFPHSEGEEIPIVDDCVFYLSEICTLSNISRGSDQNCAIVYQTSLHYQQRTGEKVDSKYIPLALLVPDNKLPFEILWELCGRSSLGLLASDYILNPEVGEDSSESDRK